MHRLVAGTCCNSKMRDIPYLTNRLPYVAMALAISAGRSTSSKNAANRNAARGTPYITFTAEQSFYDEYLVK